MSNSHFTPSSQAAEQAYRAGYQRAAKAVVSVVKLFVPTEFFSRLKHWADAELSRWRMKDFGRQMPERPPAAPSPSGQSD
jgi:hypothetical protein